MALTTLPAAGAKLRASTLAALMTEVRPVSARKTIDEIVNNSNVLQDDDALFVPLAASTTYRIAMDVIWISGTTPDIQFAWTTPAGATGNWTITAIVSGAGYFGSLLWSQTAAIDGSGADVFSRVEGVLTTTSAGTLRLRWSQTTANATDTIVRANSLLIATQQQT